MAVLQRINLLPNERLGTPDVRALEAFSLNDWRFFIKGVMSRGSMVLQGFDISNYSQIFTTPGFKVKVNNVVLFQPENDTQAAGFYSYSGTEADKTVPLSPNSNNFIEADLSAASGSPDVRAFWDQGAANNEGSEFTDTVDTVINLEIAITSNITGFTSGKIPLYKVTTNNLGVVTSVTDCRPMMFRLGSGGTTPNPDNEYAWASNPDAAHSRMETPSTSTAFSSGNAPFQGGDKNIQSLKEWMDAVMSAIREVKGTPYWYMPFPMGGGIAGAFMNTASLVFLSGTWQHVTNGHLALVGGTTMVRLGMTNNCTIAAFADVNLTTNRCLFVVLPGTDTAVTFGMGQNGSSPIVPKSISAKTSSTITVALGGNYDTTSGKIMVRGQEFAYTTYTAGTGVFSGVTPDPSGLAVVGDDVYQLSSGSTGYLHTAVSSKVPGLSGSISEGAERTIWLALYDGSAKIQLKNADLENGEEIQVGDNTSLNVLTYIGSPFEASTQPNYATLATGAFTGTTSYNSTVGEDLTTRLSRVTSMVADKAQDKTIKFLRRGIATIVNTTSGSDQEITFTGVSPVLDIILPSSANSGIIGLAGTLSLAENQAAYFEVNRNTSFSVVNIAALTVVALDQVPLDENVFIFAYRLTSTRVFLYDGRSFAPGEYPAEPEIQQQALDRLGVSEIGYDVYTSTQIIGASDNYAQAISKLDAAAAQLISDSAVEEEVVSNLGDTLFTFSSIIWSANNGSVDMKLYRNGRKLLQDTSGGLATGFRKTGINSVEVADGARTGDSFVARMERQLNVAISDQPYWVNYVTGLSGISVPTGDQYNINTEKLSAYLNGVLLHRSSSLGVPASRFSEGGPNAIVLGASAAPSDVIAMINEDTLPTARQFVDGLAGTVLVVPTYVMGNKSLRVYRNGVLMNTASLGDPEDWYAETSVNTITLADASVIGDVWCFHVLSVVPDFREEYQGVTGTTLTLSNPYTLGDERLLVYRNGILMLNNLTFGFPVDRYLEATTTSITLASAAAVDEWFTFIYK